MAPSIHNTGVPLPKAPAHAHVVRAKPDFTGIIFHVLSAAIMANGFVALLQLGMTEWINGQVGGHFQFLTIDGLWLTIITCLLGGMGEMLPGVPLLRSLKRAFLSIALPVELTIATIYWGLILLAPGLIVPDMADVSKDTSGPVTSSSSAPQLLRIPMWIDVCIHGVPAVVLVIDFFVREKKYKPPVSTWGAVVLSAIAGSAYTVWVEYCASYNDRFPYPFLPSDSFGARLAIYVGATGFAYLAFKFLNGLHA
ncbi:hypothetical protein NCC49_006125 [Naganishia albida]|nr:hypothetical protein NCC49_006125 [Naganishia albida]